MLDMVFMQVLDLSKTASVVILVVMAARFLLKKAPKAISYALWGVVLFRLLCPVSIEAGFSIVPEFEPVSEHYSLSEEPISVLGASEAAYQAIGDALNGGLDTQQIRTTETNESGNAAYVTSRWWEVWVLFGQYVWVAGLAVMVIFSLVSYAKLRGKLVGSMHLEDNVYLADHISSPFVMGLIRPKIYLPSSLGEKEREYILLHEQYHIRRFDHWAKALSFFALCVHWFNPLVWTAFMLSGKDMEMSCDEAVVRKMGEEVRADYASSLLSLATGHRIIAGTPLAFGEGNPKDRIRNLANWKKPAFWVILMAILLCVVLGVCLLTNSGGMTDEEILANLYEELEELQACDRVHLTVSYTWDGECSYYTGQEQEYWQNGDDWYRTFTYQTTEGTSNVHYMQLDGVQYAREYSDDIEGYPDRGWDAIPESSYAALPLLTKDWSAMEVLEVREGGAMDGAAYTVVIQGDWTGSTVHDTIYENTQEFYLDKDGSLLGSMNYTYGKVYMSGRDWSGIYEMKTWSTLTLLEPDDEALTELIAAAAEKMQ